MLLMSELHEKQVYISFLNEKIQGGMENPSLKKISNLYRNHTKKNSSRLKIELGLGSSDTPDGASSII
jgi:hypothetical protein